MEYTPRSENQRIPLNGNLKDFSDFAMTAIACPAIREKTAYFLSGFSSKRSKWDLALIFSSTVPVI
jgi:hypothetical protein